MAVSGIWPYFLRSPVRRSNLRLSWPCCTALSTALLPAWIWSVKSHSKATPMNVGTGATTAETTTPTSVMMTTVLTMLPPNLAAAPDISDAPSSTESRALMALLSAMKAALRPSCVASVRVSVTVFLVLSAAWLMLLVALSKRFFMVSSVRKLLIIVFVDQ
uniref:Transmembrane protein n=1 Tax=Pseudomonas fluorescens (strain SBW25) TaxID=216595 RepID=A4V7D4_PSEFS|nr:putative transmembrane protein [Pseudomonas fluorescens SBW25]